MNDFELLLDLVKDSPDDWMMTFGDGGKVTLEYFGKDPYSGELEAGCGDWSVEGTLAKVVEKAKKRLHGTDNT